jgi:hypothetical protein
MEHRTCLQCSKEFVSKRRDKRFCSANCRSAHFYHSGTWVDASKLRPFIQRLISADLARKHQTPKQNV